MHLGAKLERPLRRPLSCRWERTERALSLLARATLSSCRPSWSSSRSQQRNFVLALLSVLLFGDLVLASAQAAEKRIALVVGNANYSSGALPTPANDAGLIAQTLQAAGFDVVGVRDLDQDSLRRTFRDFIAKVSAAGPDTVSFIYHSGSGFQLEGENYFVPTDANIARDVNVSSEALRLSDYTKPLAALGIKVSMVVLDGARAVPFAKSGPPLASGLALVEPDPGTLIAFNAAPGNVAPDAAGPTSSSPPPLR